MTRANKDCPVYIKTPKGTEVEEGYCIQAVGNLYGFSSADQNFSIEVDKCVTEMGYINTPWDHKLFYKWINCHRSKRRLSLVRIRRRHTRMGCPYQELQQAQIYSNRLYRQGVRRNQHTHDDQFNYYMDHTRMITEIVEEANATGAKEEKLPYPMGKLPLSKKDCATEDQKQECAKYPYRRVVGQLIH